VDPTAEPALRRALTADARTTVGELIGARLPVALETVDRDADHAAWEWLRSLGGVIWIDLVWITIDPDDAEKYTPGRKGRRKSFDGAEL